MAFSVIDVKQMGTTRVVTYFIESAADLLDPDFPQLPGPAAGLGSVAYDKNFNIWNLTSTGWEAA